MAECFKRRRSRCNGVSTIIFRYILLCYNHTLIQSTKVAICIYFFQYSSVTSPKHIMYFATSLVCCGSFFVRCIILKYLVFIGYIRCSQLILQSGYYISRNTAEKRTIKRHVSQRGLAVWSSYHIIPQETVILLYHKTQ